MGLIEEIKEAISLEVRVSPDVDLHFEAVFQSQDLDKLLSLLRKDMGEPLKPPGKNVRLPRDVQKIVNIMGGLRREQSFYMKKEAEDRYTYVALWPWESDPSKITLKIRKGRLAA